MAGNQENWTRAARREKLAKIIPCVVGIVKELKSKMDNNTLTYAEYVKYLNELECVALYRKLMHFDDGFWEKTIPNSNGDFFKDSFRMEANLFDILFHRLAEVWMNFENGRRFVPIRKKMAIALYTLGSTKSYDEIAEMFAISFNTSVCSILHEFCHAVVLAFSKMYLNTDFLNDENINRQIAEFRNLRFPQCLGAVGVCHLKFGTPCNETDCECPSRRNVKTAKDSPEYRNSSGWQSVALMALVDGFQRFTYIDFGTPGCYNTSEIYQKSTLRKMLNECPFLMDKVRIMRSKKVPVMIIGDSSFPLSEHLMKPYPYSTIASKQERTFNYYLGISRQVVQIAFDDLRFRFNRLESGLDTEIGGLIIKTCCILHNFLRDHDSNIVDKWRLIAGSFLKQPPHQKCIARNGAAEGIRAGLAKHLCKKRGNKKVM